MTGAYLLILQLAQNKDIFLYFNLQNTGRNVRQCTPMGSSGLTFKTNYKLHAKRYDKLII